MSKKSHFVELGKETEIHFAESEEVRKGGGYRPCGPA